MALYVRYTPVLLGGGGGGTVITLGNLDAQAANAKALALVSNVLSTQSADATHPGVVNNTAQTFSGVKTFSSAPNLSSLTASTALVLDGSNNIASLAYGSTNTASTLVERDPSGNFSAGTITASLTGAASLNVLTSALGNLTDAGTDGITVTGGTGAVVGSVSIAQQVATTSHNGYLSATDWTTFNNKGSGTVTAVSVASSNGFAGTSSGGATPALTLTTSINAPVLAGNGTAISAATTTGTGSTVVLSTGPSMTNPVVGTQTALDNSTKAASTAYADSAVSTAKALCLLIANNLSDVNSKSTSFNNISPITTTGDMIYSSSGTTNARLALGTQYQVLQAGATTPTYAALALNQSAAVTGALGATNGGTAQSTYTTGDMLYASGTNTLSKLSAGTTGYVLTMGASVPAWSAASGGSSTFYPPTFQRFLIATSSTYYLNYVFTISSGNATVGATYTNNGITFTVYNTVSSSTVVVMSGSGAPTSSGTLTKASGTGDATLTFSAYKTPLYLKVHAVAGGGGGGGSGNPAGTPGGTGGTGGGTTFGTSLITSNGGVGGGGGGTPGNGGAGGTTSIVTSSTVFTILAQPGNGGGCGSDGFTNAGLYPNGGAGGGSAEGGGGGWAHPYSSGGAGAANTGGGGAGAGDQSGAYAGGGGGGGGGTAVVMITSPSSSYSYAVGVGGSAGTSAGGGGDHPGSAGGTGYIVVEEFYQ